MKRLFSLLLLLVLTEILHGDPHRVLGIATRGIYYQFTVEESFLDEISLKPGEWREVGQADFEGLLDQLSSPTPISREDRITPLIKELSSLGIESAVDSLTTQTVCFITPNGQTSFCVSKSCQELTLNSIEESELIHLDGNLICHAFSTEKAMEQAHRTKAIVSLDLANPSPVIEKFRERFLGLISAYVNLLFVSKEKAHALTHLPSKQAANFLKNFCDIVIVDEGEEGCWIGSKEQLFHCPLSSDSKLLTNHSSFISGFLYGYLQNRSLKRCAELGNLSKFEKNRSISRLDSNTK